MLSKEKMREATLGLSIINNPEKYKDKYDGEYNCHATLECLEHLVPDFDSLQYLLSFIKRKLTSFDYSPVTIGLVGVQGSGKSLLPKILGNIVGKDRIAKPGPVEFLGGSNEWLINKLFVNLDEYRNRMPHDKESQAVTGTLKSISGSDTTMVRPFGQEAYNYNHGATFILTSNSELLPLEPDDRRIVIMEMPNKLVQAEFMSNFSGMANLIDYMEEETPDFCYFLATQVDALEGDSYTIPPVFNKKGGL